MKYIQTSLCIALVAGFIASAAAAEPISVKAGGVDYSVASDTLRIDALIDGVLVNVMPPLHESELTPVARDGDGWLWNDAEGHRFHLSSEEGDLRLVITGAKDSKLIWSLPAATDGTWLVPDGEGMAYKADDAFWQEAYEDEQCLGGTTLLSFPAWSYLTETRAITYGMGDGLLSELCLHNEDGVQAKLTHQFGVGAETLDLLFAIKAPEPLAPALFYRQVMQRRGQFKTFADKTVPGLSRLFSSPQAYVWGDGRELAFLDDLKSLGINRLVLSYDQDPRTHKHVVRPDYLSKAATMGYLAGPYEAFDNGQPQATADSPVAIWPVDLYPSGCVTKADGQPMIGFANRGCYMSSEAIEHYPGPSLAGQRYAGHVRDGATQIFVDVDAFGDFFDDYSPGHRMNMAQDRTNRLSRMALAIDTYKLVEGGENVTAWSSGVNHYSHGTAQAHVSAVWSIPKRKERFGGWSPEERPAIFFASFEPTPDEARALFGSADRLPLFEAVFHDSVITSDRWEFGLMKVAGMERQRFARSLLYGTPTMWALDRPELMRVGRWLKAAQDDFVIAHGVDVPVAMTGFVWLTQDRLVQQVTYADGRVLIANFGTTSWQGLKADCVRVAWPTRPNADLCPPAKP